MDADGREELPMREYWDYLHDLKRGDHVKFENVYEHDKLNISGQGIVAGFGRFGITDLVWVDTEDGGHKGIPYHEIIKQ